jgi:glycosyltransferase involved in cell wall biosynthesis
MLKIGIDIRNIGKKRTGDEVVFFNLTKNLAEIDEKNNYFLFTDITEREILIEIVKRLGLEDKKNFKIIPLEVFGPKALHKFVWNLWTLPNYLRTNPVDTYLTQYITPFFVSKKIKIITIFHDISFNFFPQFIKLSDRFFLNTLVPLTLRRADKIIGVSKFTADEILRYHKIDAKKISWVHNAVGEEFLSEAKKKTSKSELEDIRKKYNLPQKFILYLGTLQPRKNVPTLIEAYAKLPKEIRSELKLVLAGSRGYNFDPEIDRALEKYSLKKDVPLLGYIPDEDKAHIFRLAHIFCFPSFYEGFGIPILEAFSTQTPVIASNIPPHKEIAELCAIFFNPKDPQELAEKLQFLYEDKASRDNLVRIASIQAEKFSWRKTSEKMLQIILATNGIIDRIGEKK